MIENLGDAGAFDSFGWSRDDFKNSITHLFEKAQKEQHERAFGVISLFKEDFLSGFPREGPKRGSLELLRKEKELLGFFVTGHPMTAFADVLKTLSCIPLRRIEELSEEAVFRSAFLIEVVETRISSKTQKKFAIMVISDGLESVEVPVWPDLYEKTHHLLVENQLILAVLQKEKNQEFGKLVPRWMEDLTKVDQKMIEACDRAYDAASHYGQRGTKKVPSSSKEQRGEVVARKNVQVVIDMEKLSFKEILSIKEIFESEPGDHAVHFNFEALGRKVATLFVARGVSLSSQWKERLSRQKSVIGIGIGDI